MHCDLCCGVILREQTERQGSKLIFGRQGNFCTMYHLNNIRYTQLFEHVCTLHWSSVTGEQVRWNTRPSKVERSNKQHFGKILNPIHCSSSSQIKFTPTHKKNPTKNVLCATYEKVNIYTGSKKKMSKKGD